MRLKSRRASAHLALSLAALGLPAVLSQAAHAQAVDVANQSIVGAPGAPGNGAQDPNDPNGGDFFGNNGEGAYIAPNNTGTSFVFDNDTFTGGDGGAVVGTDPAQTYKGGDGGNGLLSQAGSSISGPLVTVNSGTYTGGIGGTVTGMGSSDGSNSGSGLDVNNSMALVNGGTFIGGNQSATGGFAGDGLNANYNGVITINNGSFQGGNGGGDGILQFGPGTVDVFGGTFAGGSDGTGDGIYLYGGTTTLYGSGFLVNGTPFAGAITSGDGAITGLLQNNGAPTTITYSVNGGSIVLAPAPEPSSAASFAIGILGLGALTLKARRRAASAPEL